MFFLLSVDERFSHNHSAHFARAATDLIKLSVTHVAAHSAVVHVAVATAQLHGIETNASARFTDKQHDSSTVLAADAVNVSISCFRYSVNIRTTGAERSIHVCELALNELEVAAEVGEIEEK